jgi:phosphonate transport system substrate-binding protein
VDRRKFVFSSCTTVLLAGCKSAQTRPALRVSMIPTTDPGKIVRQSQPLVDYLQKQTGAKIDLTVPTSYAAVVEAITSNRVDIAYLGGFTYLQAAARTGVRPLVQRLKDKNFHSLFITQTNSPIHSMDDLKGKTFAFGDINSTSGHLMPSFYMRQQKVDPMVIDKAIFTGGHDATALAVAHQRVDAGAMDELVYKTMMQTGAITPAQVRVFYTTPPFFDYVWVARSGLDPVLAEKFTQALLGLDEANPQDKTLLDLLNAHKYAVAQSSDYGPLRQAAKDDGLLQ